MLTTILAYTLIPVIATLIGGTIAVYRSPGDRTRIAVQHFAAGGVFAAVGLELLPELTHNLNLLSLVTGFTLGVVLMLVVRWLTGKLEREEADGSGGRAGGSGGLVAASAVDVFIDGLLMGVSFDVGLKEGIIITIALTIELLFLAISVVSSLGKEVKEKGTMIAVVVMLALLVLIGASLGGFFLEGLSGYSLEIVIAFATAALLYLVTEELLVEAHKGPDNAFATTMFFVGFLIIMVLESKVTR
jgi:ZIP family zinc transporter